MALHSLIRFRPFSHEPKVRLLLPNSVLVLEIFATRFHVYDFVSSLPIAEEEFHDFGPFDDFTVFQDLERGVVEVVGKKEMTIQRYSVVASSDAKGYTLQMGKGSHFQPQARRERLFLGMTKAQDWTLIKRRRDMREILPVWYWLSQTVPSSEVQVTGPSLVEALLNEQDIRAIVPRLTDLFYAGFSDLLVPRLVDEEYQGYRHPILEAKSPLALLSTTRPLIRKLFFTEDEAGIKILPKLAPEFHSGTLSDIVTKKGHQISFEWTKKLIRRVEIIAACDDELPLSFQSPIDTFRVNTSTLSAPARLQVSKGKKYLLDHFQK